MYTDIKNFIMGIKENTGVDISAFLPDGQLIFGECTLLDLTTNQIGQTSVVDGYTVFPFKYKNKDYFGAIKGQGQTQNVCVYLVREIATNTAANDSTLSREEFCSAVLFGEANYSQVERYVKKYGIKNSPSFVLVLSTTEGAAGEVKNLLKNFSMDTADLVMEIDPTKIALVKFVMDENVDYHSMTEYAEFLQQSIFEETGAPIKIFIGGMAKTLQQLNYSFEQAMACCKMAETLGSNANVYSFKEFIFVKIIQDLPKHKLVEYLELLTDDVAKEVFSDKDMISTAEEFLESSLNVSETARKLYLHRNTLIYRLDKIEKETGLNIRKFSDAITFRLITVLYKMTR